jgi:PPOX class probable F420-dependent enzyme
MRLTADEARRRFATARVARLATVSAHGQPHVVPCTFAIDGELIYSAVDNKPKSTTNLQRLRNIAANPSVAVLTDHYADDWSALWWARADGQASIIEDPLAMAAPISLLAARYPHYVTSPPGGPVIAIGVNRWAGWSAA